MRILLIEDDASLTELLMYGLKEEGFSVDACQDGYDGLLLALKAAHDIILLDRMLPGMPGEKILKRMRQDGVGTPVIFITALGEPAEKINGLDLGADDYLVKPFAFEELLARIRVMLRRSTDTPTDELALADLRVDVGKHTVSRAGSRVELSAKEFAVLEYLMRNQGRVLSREQIEQHVWDCGYEGGSNMVDVYIRYLRKKLDEGYEKKLIHTVRGAGYVVREP